MHALTILHRCLGPLLSGIHARRLAQLLPASADPVIVADSGFKVPFFREVERLRWVGRVRGRDYLKLERWRSCKRLFATKCGRW
jgi:hypothetical protein